MSDDHDKHEEFWDRLDDINVGMLGLRSDARLMPMSHYADDDERMLWFIGAKGTDLVTSLADGPAEAMHVVQHGGEGLYACISGTLSLSDDRAKLDELWNAIAASWFEDGKRDDDVQLLRFKPRQAEVWLTGGSLGFLYEIAKSKITGDKPDLGSHVTLTF